MWLLDTSVVSETRRRVVATGLANFIAREPAELQFTSAVVVGELRKGAERHPDSAQREALNRWLTDVVIPSFGGRILACDPEIADLWGAICGRAMRRGEILPALDALIAATAIHHDLTIVTRNEADFLRCGALVRNPWDE